MGQGASSGHRGQSEGGGAILLLQALLMGSEGRWAGDRGGMPGSDLRLKKVPLVAVLSRLQGASVDVVIAIQIAAWFLPDRNLLRLEIEHAQL